MRMSLTSFRIYLRNLRLVRRPPLEPLDALADWGVLVAFGPLAEALLRALSTMAMKLSFEK